MPAINEKRDPSVPPFRLILITAAQGWVFETRLWAS